MLESKNVKNQVSRKLVERHSSQRDNTLYHIRSYKPAVYRIFLVKKKILSVFHSNIVDNSPTFDRILH